MHKKIILFISLAFLLSLSACSPSSSEAVYQTMQGLGKHNASCGYREIDDSVCNQEGLSYEDYSREREKLLNNNQ